jgi:hypothetical protein
LAQVLDQKERAKAAAEIEKLRSSYEAKANHLRASAAEFIGVADTASLYVPQAASARNFANLIATQLQTEAEFISAQLNHHKNAILAGTEPPRVPKPEIIVQTPVSTKRAERWVYCYSAVRWLDVEGRERTAGKYSMALLPAALARKAVERELADDLNAPRARALAECHGRSQFAADPSDCFDLDTNQPPQTKTPHVRYRGPLPTGGVVVDLPRSNTAQATVGDAIVGTVSLKKVGV